MTTPLAIHHIDTGELPLADDGAFPAPGSPALFPRGSDTRANRPAPQVLAFQADLGDEGPGSRVDGRNDLPDLSLQILSQGIDLHLNRHAGLYLSGKAFIARLSPHTRHPSLR